MPKVLCSGHEAQMPRIWAHALNRLLPEYRPPMSIFFLLEMFRKKL